MSEQEKAFHAGFAWAVNGTDKHGEYCGGPASDGYEQYRAARRMSERENADDLRPCPFCGGDARFYEVEEASNRGGYVVGCKECECSTRVWFPVKDDVRPILRDAWNRRAEPPPDA
jgi:Lar family restriction alleviation protein